MKKNAICILAVVIIFLIAACDEKDIQNGTETMEPENDEETIVSEEETPEPVNEKVEIENDNAIQETADDEDNGYDMEVSDLITHLRNSLPIDGFYDYSIISRNNGIQAILYHSPIDTQEKLAALLVQYNQKGKLISKQKIELDEKLVGHDVSMGFGYYDPMDYLIGYIYKIIETEDKMYSTIFAMNMNSENYDITFLDDYEFHYNAEKGIVPQSNIPVIIEQTACNFENYLIYYDINGEWTVRDLDQNKIYRSGEHISKCAEYEQVLKKEGDQLYILKYDSDESYLLFDTKTKVFKNSKGNNIIEVEIPIYTDVSNDDSVMDADSNQSLINLNTDVIPEDKLTSFLLELDTNKGNLEPEQILNAIVQSVKYRQELRGTYRELLYEIGDAEVLINMGYKVYYGEDMSLPEESDEVKAIINEIKARGYSPTFGEGDLFLEINTGYFRKLFHSYIPIDESAYGRIISKENEKSTLEDACIWISQDEFIARIDSAEKFLIQYSDSQHFLEIKNWYEKYLNLLFRGVDNTLVSRSIDDYKLSQFHRDLYTKILESKSETIYGQFTEYAISEIEKNNDRYTESLKQKMLFNIQNLINNNPIFIKE